jgi:hypothetical protein
MPSGQSRQKRLHGLDPHLAGRAARDLCDDPARELESRCREGVDPTKGRLSVPHLLLPSSPARTALTPLPKTARWQPIA